MYPAVIQFASVFLAGILAGEELVVRYGVHPSLGRLDAALQIRTRQALILKLRVLVPVVFLLTATASVATLIAEGTGTGFGLRCAAAAALLVWILSTLIGTVPINKAILDWTPDSPPSGWTALITRWERLDVLRSSAAVVAFACLMLAITLQL
ncbi:MAG TPA: DUF1772 domain-containing protein [Galbitalea sp.]